MRRLWAKSVAFIGALALLAGCASNSTSPVDAAEYNRSANIHIQWRIKLDDGPGKHFTRLQPALDEQVLYMAGSGGTVRALQLNNAKQLWRTHIKQPISAGVSLAGERLLISTRDGHLVSLDKSNGQEQWRTPLSSEAVSVAASDESNAYIHTVDGKISAFNLTTGQRLWSYDSALPVLSVRGTSTPLIVQQLVVVGLASGKLLALDKTLGVPRWEVRLASPDGRSELERLVDIDGQPIWYQNLIYAASYHGNVAAVHPQGHVVWEEAGSSYGHPEIAIGNLYLTLDNDHIQAYDTGNGAKVWQQTALEGRKLGQVTAYRNWLASADSAGNLYVLNQIDGELVNYRLLRPTPLHMQLPNQTAATQWRSLRGKEMGIGANLIATERGLLVYSNSGELFLIDIQPKKRFLGIF